MSQQLLYNFDILPIAFEQHRKCVGETLCHDVFLFDSKLSGCGLDVVAHYAAQPDWRFPSIGPSAVGIARPYVIGRLLVRGDFILGQQIISHILVDRHRLSRCLRFHRGYVLVNERPSHAYKRAIAQRIMLLCPK
jgi:hypothetical protein